LPFESRGLPVGVLMQRVGSLRVAAVFEAKTIVTPEDAMPPPLPEASLLLHDAAARQICELAGGNTMRMAAGCLVCQPVMGDTRCQRDAELAQSLCGSR